MLFSCNKPEPEPELRDPIYLDLKSQAELAKKTLADARQTLEIKKVELEKVKPQTGAIKYAQKRYWEAQKEIDGLIQQEKSWQLRLEARQLEAREEYLKAFKAEKPWPSPKYTEDYNREKRLRAESRRWDVNYRLEKFKKENAPTSKPASKE